MKPPALIPRMTEGPQAIVLMPALIVAGFFIGVMLYRATASLWPNTHTHIMLGTGHVGQLGAAYGDGWVATGSCHISFASAGERPSVSCYPTTYPK